MAFLIILIVVRSFLENAFHNPKKSLGRVTHEFVCTVLIGLCPLTGGEVVRRDDCCVRYDGLVSW